MTRLQSLSKRYQDMHAGTARAIQKERDSEVWERVAKARLAMLARLAVKLDEEELRLL